MNHIQEASNSNATFLFTSESVGEGHPGIKKNLYIFDSYVYKKKSIKKIKCATKSVMLFWTLI
jgi:S-adenosylmethionine synthetase